MGRGTSKAGSAGYQSILPANFDSVRYGGGLEGYTSRYLLSKGYTEEEITEMRRLFKWHTTGGESQKIADAELEQHARDMDRIGEMLLEKAKVEEAAGAFDADQSYKKDIDHWKFTVEQATEGLKPGGIYENYTREDLIDWGIIPEKPTKKEPRVYRLGSMNSDSLAFSSNRNGADFGYGHAGYDHSFTLAEMKKMGYRPIAGIAAGDVGSPGEAEVLFIKFGKKKGRKS